MIGSIQDKSLYTQQLVDMASRAGKPVGEGFGVSSQQKELDVEREASSKKELEKELIQLSQELNDEMKMINTSIKVGYSYDIPGLVVTVKDANEDKVIREIPTKEAIELMKKMRDIVGMIFDKKG